MSFQPPSIGTLCQFGWDTVDPVTHAYEYFYPFDVQATQEFIYPNGIRGQLDEQGETAATGIIRVDGTLPLKPTYTLLSTICLQAIMGGSPTGTGPMTYPSSNSLFNSNMTIDRVSHVDKYSTTWVDRATFESEEGRELQLSLDILAQTETLASGGSFPGGLVAPYEPPFVHSSSGTSFTINGSARQVKRISFRADNHMTRDRFFNATTLQTPAKQFRTYDIVIRVPKTSDNDDLYQLSLGTVAAGVFAWYDGTHTLTLTCPYLQLNGKVQKVIEGKSELFYEVPLRARRHTTGDALSITL